MHHHWRLARAAILLAVVAGALPIESSFAAEVSFGDSFTASGTIEEAWPMSASASPDWWVNSGGRLVRSGGLGSTVQGELPANDPWAQAYAASNPVDTDNGSHPQNIFRLVTRRTWTTFQQTAWFRIRRTQMSASPNRNASNGLLFFHRYLDGNNLYYAGIRVDGAAVVKKKQAGVYTTLGYSKIYPGTWERTANPNLLPIDRWIGLRTVTRTQTDGSVRLTLEVSDSGLGAGWTPALDVVDTDAAGTPIVAAGYAGVRTDFMDVELEDYEAAPWSGSTPPSPTATPPAPTPTRTPTPSPTATRTPTPVPPPTATPPPTAAPAPTSPPPTAPPPTAPPPPTAAPPTFTPPPTATFAAPTPTATKTPSAVQTPTRTPTRSPTPTPTKKKFRRSV